MNGYISLFTVDELDQIYQSSLDILFKVGIHIPNKEILSIMKKYGAMVDEKKQTVRFQKNLTEEVANIAKREKDEGWQGYAPARLLWWAPTTIGDTWQVSVPETDKIGFGDACPFYYDWTENKEGGNSA